MDQDSASTFTISRAESLAFAALTGDFNPLHVDPVAARRLMFGGTVLHGLQVCLKAIEVALAGSGEAFVLGEVEVQFAGPVRDGEQIELQRVPTRDGRVKLRLLCDGEQIQTITLRPGTASRCEIDLPDRLPAEQGCRELTIADVARASGAVPLELDRLAAAALFPRLARAMPVRQLASLLAATRIVGMRCPGRHSLFAELHMRFGEPDRLSEPSLAFRVEHIDERFSLATLSVTGPGVAGHLHTLVRPAPVEQASYQAAQRAVARGEFAGQRALVVGGSRGLGELSAKIIAAGGGEVVITYASGRDDAERVCREIRDGKGVCRSLAFDVLAPDRKALAATLAASPPTHVLYFATPLIQLTDPASWRESLFRRFCDYYLTGLFRTLTLAQELSGSGPLTLINPSTVFLEQEEPRAKEYTAAKAASEMLCRSLMASDPQLSCHCPRLPRLDTDQTRTFMAPQLHQSSMTVMLGVLRAACASGRRLAMQSLPDCVGVR